MAIDNLNDFIGQVQGLNQADARTFFQNWNNAMSTAFLPTQDETDQALVDRRTNMLNYINNSIPSANFDGTETAGEVKTFIGNLIENNRSKLYEYIGDDSRIDAWKLVLQEQLTGADNWTCLEKLRIIIIWYKDQLN